MGIENLSRARVWTEDAALTASYQYTTSVKLDGADFVDYFFNLDQTTGGSSITVLTFKLQSSDDGTTWYEYQFEDSTPTWVDFAAAATISGDVVKVISQPAKGLYVRLGVIATTGTATNSVLNVFAVRRVVSH